MNLSRLTTILCHTKNSIYFQSVFNFDEIKYHLNAEKELQAEHPILHFLLVELENLKEQIHPQFTDSLVDTVR